MYPEFDTKILNKSPYLGENHRQFVEQPTYPFSSETPTLEIEGEEVVCLHAVPLWDFMMDNIFPGLSQEEFNAEKAKVLAVDSNAQTIYERLFYAMLEDIYLSVFEGRDDTTNDQQFTLDQFQALDENEKDILFQSYLTTRFHGTSKLPSDQRLLTNLELRASNMRIWASYALMRSLEQIQRHTINTGRLATRNAQTAQSISTEMIDPKYSYRPLLNSSDYEGQHRNQRNSKLLEDLKTFRLVIQKKVDRSSAELTKVNNDAEIFSNFISKLFETDLNMVRGLFS
ncbi:hypothetical protein [Candidatus Similichlamydia laticola]|uniref:Uncharacterized protein n=1 Tax=Candidatus Similichlamydia laticola TaxID=2170265 RepID=A0A369KB15_9BACT|nr:hypothetical protein [Candidatus Similichlamydia laticola]RDB31801.1 hypothetical protein HAT2_00090 [Candidatus Similichlamydia laticola]